MTEPRSVFAELPDAGLSEDRSVLSASVVVCAYTLDRWDLLVAAVRAAASQQPAPCELVLVVDHNPELAARAARELEDEQVRVVENRYGRGLSGARNSGIEAARGELVAFLDDDALPADGWLAALLGPFADPRVVATGGTARPAWAAGRPGWFPEEFDWVVGCSYRGQPEGLAEVRNPLGCNMAFRRHVFADVDGFREGVGRIGKRPLGCEETELCIRLRHRWPGSRILLVPEAVVDHHVTPERHGFAYFRQRCFAEGISKAAVTGQVGTGDGLSSERSYVTRTLPRGVVAGLGAALRGSTDRTGGRRRDGLRRAGAIVAGCGITMAGYLRGRLSADRGSRSPAGRGGRQPAGLGGP
jgi:glucosyl-dolichyl phosphate glucuronosyltransferase